MSAQILLSWLVLAPLAASSAAPANVKAQAQKPVVAAKAPAPQAPKAAPVAAAPVPPPPSPTPAPEPVVEATPPAQAAAPERADPPVLAQEAAQAADWLSQNEPRAQGTEPMQRWPLVVAMLLLLAGGGAFLTLRVRQGQLLWPGGVSGHAIDILAIKALGHKHKLVLVEAAGERLLLAATEREVRLLSHISSQEGLAIDAQADAGQIDAMTRGMGPQAQRPGVPPGGVHPASAAAAGAYPAPPATPSTQAHASAYATYMATEPLTVPMVAPAAPASHESLSAEALYEGAARSIDLDEQDDELDESQAASPPESPDALASDVAGLARWRQAAAQGAETWGKQV